jgi:hypothetical protein
VPQASEGKELRAGPVAAWRSWPATSDSAGARMVRVMRPRRAAGNELGVAPPRAIPWPCVLPHAPCHAPTDSMRSPLLALASLGTLVCATSCYSLVDVRVEAEIVQASNRTGPPCEVVYFEPVGNPGLDPVSTILLYPFETLYDVLEAPSLLRRGGSRVKGGYGGAFAAILLPGLNLRSGGLKGPMFRYPRSVDVDDAQWAELGGENGVAVAASAFGIDPSAIDEIRPAP